MADCDKSSSSGKRLQDVPLQFTKDFAEGGNTQLRLDAMKDGVPEGMYRWVHFIDIPFVLNATLAAVTGAMEGFDVFNLFKNIEVQCKGGALYTGISGRQIRLMYWHRNGAPVAPDPADGVAAATANFAGVLRIFFDDPGTNPGDDTAWPVSDLKPTIKISFGDAGDLGTDVTINSFELEATARVEDNYDIGVPRMWTVTTIAQTTDTPSVPKGDYIAALIIDQGDAPNLEDASINAAAVAELLVPDVFEYPQSFASIVARWNADYARDSDNVLNIAGFVPFLPALFLPGYRKQQSLGDCIGSSTGAITFKIVSGTLENPNTLVWYFEPTTRFDREMQFKRIHPEIDIRAEGGLYGLKPKTRSGKPLSLDQRAALSLRWKAVPIDKAEIDAALRRVTKGGSASYAMTADGVRVSGHAK